MSRPAAGNPPAFDYVDRDYTRETPLQTLLYWYGAERGQLAFAAVAYAIKHSPVWLTPLLTANMIDAVVQNRPLAEVWLNALVLAGLVLMNVPVNFLYARALSAAARRIETNLRAALVRRLQHLSIGYYAQVSPGVLQAKVLRDVESLEQLLRNLGDGGLAAFSTFLGALAVTALRAPVFLLFFLVAVPLAAGLTLTVRRALAERNAQFRQQLERLSARMTTMTHLIPVTRAHGLEAAEITSSDELLSEVQRAGRQLDAVNALFGSLAWASFNLLNLACLVVAAWGAYTQQLPVSVGEVVLVTSYFNQLTGGVLYALGLAPVLGRALESVRSLREVLTCPDLEHNDGKRAVQAVRGEFTFESVSFRYPEGEAHAVQDFSFHVAPGQTVAIVGPSGSGKSTLLSLIIGFIRPNSGRLLLDGQDMRTLDLRTYRRFLSVVPQETVLFEGTIRDNVCYGVRAVSDAQLEAALRAANAWEFVGPLPDGLATPVGERGLRLSGGQKQRLAIARAFIRDPRVLILDEATSALDTASEALVQAALARLMRPARGPARTTFVVAHRLSTVRNADVILVLEHGRLVEWGVHSELLARGGAYARLVSVQMPEFAPAATAGASVASRSEPDEIPHVTSGAAAPQGASDLGSKSCNELDPACC